MNHKGVILSFVALAVMLACAACGKSEDKPTQGKSVKTANPEDRQTSPRRVAIQVTRDGYDPDMVKAKPNEEVILAFTRVDDADCGQYVKVEDGKETELPLNEPVDIPIIMPESGEVTFVCGMGVMKGVVLVVAN